MASKAAYGPNPNAGVNVNADHGWGGYQWPNGVPGSLLGTTDYQQVNGAKQRLRVTVRKELVGLLTLSFALADRKHGYQLWATKDGTNWGPWGYENRAIAGTNTASNHSKGKAWDGNAPNNPYTAAFITDYPPALVADLERIGWCWGGRYTGSTDTMHWEYGYTPADVARHTALAQQLLGTDPGKPGNDDEWWFDVATEDQRQEFKELVRGGMKWFFQDVDAKWDLPVLREQVRQVVQEELAKLPSQQLTAPSVEDIWNKQIPSEITGAPESAARMLQATNTRVYRASALDATNPPPPPPVPATYTVQAGDTLSAIAKRFGFTVNDLVVFNNLKDADSIEVGQVLGLGKA